MNKKELIVSILSIILLVIVTIEISSHVVKEKIKQNNQTTSVIMTQTTTTSSEQTTKKATKKVVKTTKKVVKSSGQVKSGTYKVTHYGPDCKGCSGITASGYNVKNTIWYDDYQYGKIRIVASKNIPLYSVIRMNDYGDGNVIAIVLDRCRYNGIIDVLVSSEKEAANLGIKKNISIDVLRKGK